MGRPMVSAGDEVSASLLAGCATADDVGLYRRAGCPLSYGGGRLRAWHTGTTSTTFCRSDDPKRLTGLQQRGWVELTGDPRADGSALPARARCGSAPPVAHSHGAVESLARRYEMWRPHLTERRRRFAGLRWARAVSSAFTAAGGSPHRRGVRPVADTSSGRTRRVRNSAIGRRWHSQRTRAPPGSTRSPPR